MAAYKVHVKQTQPVILETFDIDADSHEEAQKKAQEFIDNEKEYGKDIELQVDEVPENTPVVEDITDEDGNVLPRENTLLANDIPPFEVVETEEEGQARQERLDAERAEQERNNG